MSKMEDIGAAGPTVREKHPMARAAIDRWSELRTERSRFEADWNDIARLIRPQRGGFGLTDPSTRVQDKALSSEPIMAGNAFASGLYAGITNPANRWFGFETPDDDLNKWGDMQRWLDVATSRVAKTFSPSMSSFYPATFQGYADIAAFGNFASYDEFDATERRFLDTTISLAEIVVDVDGLGRVHELVRCFRLKPRAAVRLFKGRGELPARVHELADKADNGKIAFYHHILPNVDWRSGRIGMAGKRWLSVYACEEGQWLISRKGYDDLPAYFARWDVDTGQTYGTGPGFVALPSTRVLAQIEAAKIKAAQYAADPTMLAPTREDWQLNGHVRPGHVVYGGIDMRGNQMMRPLQGGNAVGLTVEEGRQKIEEIKNAFHYAMMSLQGRTGLTPQETLIIEEANTRQWAPHGDRIMEEYASPKVERRFRALWRMGQIPPPPKEAGNVPLQVRYTSAAQMAMRAREGLAIVQFLANLGPLAQTNARYLDRLDPDATIEALHAASPSLPARILRTRDEADQLAAARAEQEQAMSQMAMLAQGAGAARDAAGAVQAMMPQGGATG